MKSIPENIQFHSLDIVDPIHKKSEKWQNTAKLLKQTKMAAKFANVACGFLQSAVASTTLEVANFTVTKEHLLSTEKRIRNISAK